MQVETITDRAHHVHAHAPKLLNNQSILHVASAADVDVDRGVRG
jgi:hypothetical protein